MAIISLNYAKKVALLMNTYRFYCDVATWTSYIGSLNFVLESDEMNETWKTSKLSKVL